MAINVYWAVLEHEWMRAEPPVEVLKTVFDNYTLSETGVARCPAFRDGFNNMYALKSLYDYEFEITDKTVGSSYYDQKFFDQHVVVRSLPERCFSFFQYYLFLTDEDSLLMTGNMFPFMESNNITERCVVFQGTYDIGRWYRNLEFPFILRKKYDTFRIEQGEIYSYVKFHTNEKINLIQFRSRDNLANLLDEVVNIRENRKSIWTMVDFYKRMKCRKQILDIVKKSVI
jgi:hypothetical protein